MLLAWLVSHQWQGFSRSDQALSDFEIFRAALLAMEKVSAERGPMNAALGEDVPMPAQRIAALRKAREESDASLRDLDAAIEASHCEECAALYVTATHAITTLAEARKHADDVLLVPRQTRSPESQIRYRVTPKGFGIPALEMADDRAAQPERLDRTEGSRWIEGRGILARPPGADRQPARHP